MADQIDLGRSGLQQNAVDVFEQFFTAFLITVDGWNVDGKHLSASAFQRLPRFQRSRDNRRFYRSRKVREPTQWDIS